MLRNGSGNITQNRVINTDRFAVPDLQVHVNERADERRHDVTQRPHGPQEIPRLPVIRVAAMRTAIERREPIAQAARAV